MNKQLRDEWVKALRSGEYAKGTGQLRKADRYCCLGVLCRVVGLRPEQIDDYGNLDNSELTREIRDANGLGRYEVDSNSFQRKLARMNDEGEKFTAIADWIESNVPVEP
jgi:hypothetical protein